MLKSQSQSSPLHPITPPLSFADEPTPPSSDKRFIQAPRILAIFKDLRESRPDDLGPWASFQLVEGEYDEIQRQLRRDDDLWGFVNDKIRYDYDAPTHRLVIRMPTKTHEVFSKAVERHILKQLEHIATGSDRAASFAQGIHPMGSSDLFFSFNDGSESKKSPDAEFGHEDDAEYPGVIIEVSFSQKRKDLARLADNYIIDSKACVQVVVGLDIEYGPKASREATISVWRLHTDQRAREYHVVADVENERFRDRDGSPSNSHGLRLRLSEFAPRSMTETALAGDDRDITISAQQLSEFLTTAERLASQKRPRPREVTAAHFKFRRKTSTPPERISSDDEARMLDREQADDERADAADPEWIGSASPNTSQRETREGRRRSG